MGISAYDQIQAQVVALPGYPRKITLSHEVFDALTEAKIIKKTWVTRQWQMRVWWGSFAPEPWDVEVERSRAVSRRWPQHFVTIDWDRSGEVKGKPPGMHTFDLVTTVRVKMPHDPANIAGVLGLNAKLMPTRNLLPVPSNHSSPITYDLKSRRKP